MENIKRHLEELKGVSDLPELNISSGDKVQAEPIVPSKRRKAYKQYLKDDCAMSDWQAETILNTVEDLMNVLKKRSLNLYQIEAIKEILECEIMEQSLFGGQKLDGAND
ncbi:MAG: hypothetical protein HPY74_06035 [Firmicutes bacterium]|nr:hypothetical protein [Bacillota bacterium]